MEKLDLTKKYRTYYTAKAKPELVDIGDASFISITGVGDPSAPAFTARIQALYPVAYGLKFQYKEQDKDFVVSKLEGLWWFDHNRYAGLSMADAPQVITRSEWAYRLLIRVPSYVTAATVSAISEQVAAKKGVPLAREVVFFQLQEGKCVQLLHVGPFDREPESLALLAQFMQERNLQHNGLHHEIYLSDFRKTAPEKLRTILREPVR